MKRAISSRFRARDIVRAFAILVALALLAAYFLARDAETVAGEARAIDGDSLVVQGAEIRLAGIDAPEFGQTCEAGGRTYHCGEEARRALAALLTRALVSCRIAGRDRYGRRLGRCRAGERDIGAALVGAGRAVGADGDYDAEEAAARQGRLGLWAGTFEAPAAWRKAHPRPQP